MANLIKCICSRGLELLSHILCIFLLINLFCISVYVPASSDCNSLGGHCNFKVYTPPTQQNITSSLSSKTYPIFAKYVCGTDTVFIFLSKESSPPVNPILISYLTSMYGFHGLSHPAFYMRILHFLVYICILCISAEGSQNMQVLSNLKAKANIAHLSGTIIFHAASLQRCSSASWASLVR